MSHQGERQFLSFDLSSQFHLCCLVLFTSDLQHTFISKYGGRIYLGTLMRSKIIANDLKPTFIYFPKGASRNINKRGLQVEVWVLVFCMGKDLKGKVSEVSCYMVLRKQLIIGKSL